MNPHFKNVWLEALRSQDFDQCRGPLHFEVSHSALGVLCEVSAQGTWITRIDGSSAFQFDGETAVSLLPASLRREVGLTDREQEICWRLNDQERLSFREIADRLEALIPADHPEFPTAPAGVIGATDRSESNARRLAR